MAQNIVAQQTMPIDEHLRILRERADKRDAERKTKFREMIDDLLVDLAVAARNEVLAQNVPPGRIQVVARIHLRYAGTDTALVVPFVETAETRAAFERAYRARYSFLMPERALIVEAISVEAIGATESVPANPPAVGDPTTIGQRTTDFLLLELLVVVVIALAVASLLGTFAVYTAFADSSIPVLMVSQAQAYTGKKVRLEGARRALRDLASPRSIEATWPATAPSIATSSASGRCIGVSVLNE